MDVYNKCEFVSSISIISPRQSQNLRSCWIWLRPSHKYLARVLGTALGRAEVTKAVISVRELAAVTLNRPGGISGLIRTPMLPCSPRGTSWREFVRKINTKYCHSRHAGHLAHVVDDPDIISRGYFSHRPWFYPLAHFLPKMLIIEVNVVAQSSP